MPRLTLLCEYATLNGGEQSMLATLDGVRRLGFTPRAIAPPEGPLADALRCRDVELLPLITHDNSGGRLSLDRRREVLADQLRRGTDLLHANSLSMGRLSGPVAAQLNLPSVVHLRDIINLSRQALMDLNCHGRLLAVSQATREYHVAAGLDAEKTHVLYNGVDLDRFAPRPASGYLHRELRLPDEAILVGTIGQIGARKGQDVLAGAARLVAARVPNVHFLVIGRRHSQKDESRRFETDLRAAADALSGRMHLLGVRHDVDRLLGELALLAHPARQEPLGRVLLESAAAGVAVVASDVGGTREIFPPQRNAAILVPPDDIRALADAIEQLIEDEPMRNCIATAARHRAEEAFGSEQASDALVEHYRALV